MSLPQLLGVPPAFWDRTRTRAAGVTWASGDCELISPPPDGELYNYYGPQRRWAQALMSGSFLLAAASLARFSTSAWFLTPLLLVLTLNLVAMLFSALSGWNRRRGNANDHDALVHAWMSGRREFPSVDVFLPTCGEDIEVLRNTYRYVEDLRWLGEVNVWVLDDADRSEVAAEAHRFGYRYVVRPDRGRMKKAGNLRHAFGLSTATYIAIFDADFAPRHDYLLHLVPYLDDPGVGIVQSPQYFATSTSMSWLERAAGSTQELFYRWVQPSRDAVGGAICVGTCAVYRRSALAEIGGFAQIEHSEDVRTGISLLRAGYQTRYIPVVVSRGLCPDNLAGFLNQQYRWCNGSITLLRTSSPHTRPLSVRQRICFWAGFLYYITTAVNVFLLHVPGLLMAVFFADQVRPEHFVPFLASAWVYFALMPRLATSRWRFEVLRVQMAYGFAHALAITHNLFGRSKGWVATGAVGRSSGLARTISIVGVATIGLTAGVAWTAVSYDIATRGVADYWPMVLFLAGYTYLSGPLFMEFLRVLDVVPSRLASRVRRHGEPAISNRIPGDQFVAVTVVILAIGAVASGLWPGG